MRRTLKLLTALALMLLAPAAAHADTYVSPLGTDTNPCTDTQPCATFKRAGQALNGGGTVHVQPGGYVAQMIDTLRPAAPVTYLLAPGANVASVNARGSADLTFDGNQQQGVIRQFEFQRGTTGQWAQRDTIRSVNMIGQVRAFNNVTDLLIDSSRFYDGDTAISGPARPRGALDESRRITIRNSTFEHFWADGIAISDWRDVLVEGDTFRDIWDWTLSGQHTDALQTSGGVVNLTVQGDSFSQVGHSAIIIQGGTPAADRPTSNVVVKHNLVWRPDDETSGPTEAMRLDGDVRTATICHNILHGRLNDYASGAVGGSSTVPTGVTFSETDC